MSSKKKKKSKAAKNDNSNSFTAVLTGSPFDVGKPGDEAEQVASCEVGKATPAPSGASEMLRYLDPRYKRGISARPKSLIMVNYFDLRYPKGSILRRFKWLWGIVVAGIVAHMVVGHFVSGAPDGHWSRPIYCRGLIFLQSYTLMETSNDFAAAQCQSHYSSESFIPNNGVKNETI